MHLFQAVNKLLIKKSGKQYFISIDLLVFFKENTINPKMNSESFVEFFNDGNFIAFCILFFLLKTCLFQYYNKSFWAD